MMTQMPEIGTRVRYRAKFLGEVREVTGTVVKQWPKAPGLRRTDSASVKVDAIPDWWPYPHTDRFAPDISDLTPID
jgi:hypothetical protein